MLIHLALHVLAGNQMINDEILKTNIQFNLNQGLKVILNIDKTRYKFFKN